MGLWVVVGIDSGAPIGFGRFNSFLVVGFDVECLEIIGEDIRIRILFKLKIGRAKYPFSFFPRYANKVTE